MSKIDTIREKTDEISAEITAEQQKNNAHSAGFDDYADYELWLALDALRKATLARRAMFRGTRPLVIDNPIVGTVVNTFIDSSRI